MLPGTLLKIVNVGRLRLVLSLLFLTLTVPTAALIWQAMSQLKWEAFYQHRGMAEELTRRIDADLIERINTAESRDFGDYAFLVTGGDPASNLLQRSPLSAFPVLQDLPGVIGYFQVDAAGAFSTPLLPPSGAPADKLGISADEFEQRQILAGTMQKILADNRLIRDRPVAEGRLRPAAVAESPSEEGPAASSTGGVASLDAGNADSDAAGGKLRGALDDGTAEPTRQSAKSKEDYSQRVFDELNTSSPAPVALSGTSGENEVDLRNQQTAYGKIADLKLDASLQKKSESLERKDAFDESMPPQDAPKTNAAVRARRLEQVAVPESVSPPTPGIPTRTDEMSRIGSSRITTFASEIDPFEFSLLDSGHLVLFRKVWRNGERLIQGVLLDTQVFLSEAIERNFRATSLASMSDLVVGYQDDIVEVIRGRSADRYPVSSQELQGTLLYRNRLSAPLDRLDLIFSINRLPPGPGARVLLWITLVIGVVFLSGFYVLYRLGLAQINVTRQQQDFVAAVSHELKTPLTSIRMYGEMLKEGWVSEDKRRQYYDYIHDESERLTRLISNVLQLAKITRSAPQFDLKSKAVAELMNQIESKISSQIERAGFAFTMALDTFAAGASVRVDEDSIAQIIINLVDNAIKFSRNAENKTIEISAQASSDNHITISVRDFGPGIPRDQMKKIFQLFYRTESELTRETVGTGIGLAIVHQLTLAMNGKIDVVNKKPGAEFRLTFPVMAG
jgi:signal transduction histidine kinase